MLSRAIRATSRGWEHGIRCMSVNAVHIMYGSQSGTAAYCAEVLGDDLSREGFTTNVVDQRTLSSANVLSMVQPDDVAVFINSCFGQGEPTDSAKPLFKMIQEENSGFAKGSRFAVFGLGNSRSHAEHYNVVAKELNSRLEELGGERVHEVGLGDDADDLEADFEDWAADLLPQIKKLVDLPPRGSVQVVEEVAGEEEGGDVGEGDEKKTAPLDAFEAIARSHGLTRRLEVVGHSSLSRKGARPCTQVEFRDVDGDGEEWYSTGDHLMVLPENVEMGQLLCEELGIDARAKVDTSSIPNLVEGYPQWVPGAVLAASMVEFSVPPPPRALRVLSSFATDPEEAKHLEEVAQRGGPYETYVRRANRTILDVLHEHPSVHISLPALIPHLPHLKPRTYSISSSPKLGQRLHVSIRRIPNGVCSPWITDLPLHSFVMGEARASTFHLPSDHETPVVMIAAGIGIAPFKAFLEEGYLEDREAGGEHRNRIMLRCFTDPWDSLYDDLIRRSLKDGVLRHCLTSFERGVGEGENEEVLEGVAGVIGPRGRIEDAMGHEETAQLVKEALDNGGHVYVCGGAAGYGAAVSRAVEMALRPGEYKPTQQDVEFNRSAPPGGAVAAMLQQNRYHEDLAD